MVGVRPARVGMSTNLKSVHTSSPALAQQRRSPQAEGSDGPDSSHPVTSFLSYHLGHRP